MHSRSGRRPWCHRIVCAVGAVATAGTFGSAALAQERTPAPSSSAVSQYAELIPSGTGPTAPGVDETQLAELTPSARYALASRPDAVAKALATVATSSDYGAPKTTDAAATTPPGESYPGDEPSLDRTFQAAATAASPGGDAYMVGLLLALLFVTAGGATVAIRTRSA